MSTIEAHRLAEVKVSGHKNEPDAAVLSLTTHEGDQHHFDMTASELWAMAHRLASAARMLDRRETTRH